VTDISVVIIIVKRKNCIVGNNVCIIEEQTVKTETIAQLEVIIYVPVVLCIKTGLVETYPGCWLLLTVVTISKSHYFRSCAIDEVIYAVVSVITCTITHINVVSHLILCAQTEYYLMVTCIISEVILECCYSIVNTIVQGKELISERKVIVTVLLDVDEWEHIRSCTSNIVKLRICHEELI